MSLDGFGVRMDGKALQVHTSPDDFALRKHNLVQAMLAVNDMFYLTVSMVASLFYEDVVAWLDVHEVRYTPRVKFTGKTGYDYLFDFVIPRSRSQPERIIQTINRPNRDTAQSVVHSWVDIREVRSPESHAYALLSDSDTPCPLQSRKRCGAMGFAPCRGADESRCWRNWRRERCRSHRIHRRTGGDDGRGRGMTCVSVNPDLLRWARERSGLAQRNLATKFSKLPEWESDEIHLMLKQVEAFARTVHLPVGYLFLAESPEEPLPIPDFRTIAAQPVTRPSPNLLDTIYICQERQSWYRDFARIARQPELGFVDSATVEMSPEAVAARMWDTLDFDLAARRECPTWTEALRLFIRQADEAGVLVMVSGVVMSNTHRRLDPAEFRGFALSDTLTPLVFVNGADTKAAQMFTLAHELAHLWLGDSALSNIGAVPRPGLRREEVRCNAVESSQYPRRANALPRRLPNARRI